IIGIFQYFLLYHCPQPGKIAERSMAVFGLNFFTAVSEASKLLPEVSGTLLFKITVSCFSVIEVSAGFARVVSSFFIISAFFFIREVSCCCAKRTLPGNKRSRSKMVKIVVCAAIILIHRNLHLI